MTTWEWRLLNKSGKALNAAVINERVTSNSSSTSLHASLWQQHTPSRSLLPSLHWWRPTLHLHQTRHRWRSLHTHRLLHHVQHWLLQQHLPRYTFQTLKQTVQNSAARLLTLTYTCDHVTPVLQKLHWLTQSQSPPQPGPDPTSPTCSTTTPCPVDHAPPPQSTTQDQAPDLERQNLLSSCPPPQTQQRLYRPHNLQNTKIRLFKNCF